MNVLKAAEDTIALVAMRVAEGHSHTMQAAGDLGFMHLQEMLRTMRRSNKEDPPMSYGKANRWLGWMQCNVVACGIATLEEMKAINAKHAKDEWTDCDMGSDT